MPANRLNITIDNKNGFLIYTEAESCNSILPMNIRQDIYELEEDIQGYAITRMELLNLISTKYEIKEQYELATLYTDKEWNEPITWIEFAYLATYVFNTTNTDYKQGIPFETDIPLCMKEDFELITKYKNEMTITEYLEDIRLGGSYMPASLYVAYKLLQKKIGISDTMMFKQISHQNMTAIERVK